MGRLFAFVRLDASALRGNALSFGLIGLFATAMAWMGSDREPLVAVLVPMALAAFTPMHFFASDERGHLDVLFSVLPIGRRQVVAGRFLGIALLLALIAATSAAAAGLIARVVGAPLPAHDLAAALAMSVAAASVLIGVQVPVYFGLGMARTRAWPQLAILLVFFGGSWAAGRLDGVPQWATQAVGSAWLPPAAMAVAVLVLLVSCAVLTRLYTRRSL
ncbi:ABC-2 transporter permease [Schaalia naturae]|uniref:ABC-2 transporter permease n=1 Tax=Schaalia naturae TaxID=635203 RepID=A0ABW2SIE6_9ACTO